MEQNNQLHKILTPISEEEATRLRMIEIQKRLRSQDAVKARKLLSLAMSQRDALTIVTKDIEKKINGFPYSFKR